MRDGTYSNGKMTATLIKNDNQGPRAVIGTLDPLVRESTVARRKQQSRLGKCPMRFNWPNAS